MLSSAFFKEFPKIAECETRVIKILKAHGGLPPDDYALVDFYCDDPGCDCRRVIIQVWGNEKPGLALATFNYGWETKKFYTRWMHGNSEAAEEMKGLSLEPFGPQSKLSEALFTLVAIVIAEDADYRERLKRHYKIFKRAQKSGSDTA